jgi:putative polymerase
MMGVSGSGASSDVRAFPSVRVDANRALAASVVLGCVAFNALLAIVSAHVHPLTSTHVILAEGALVAAAALAIAKGWSARMTPAVTLIVAMALFCLLRGAITGEVQPKYLRDVLIIPLFAMLGMAFAGGDLVRVAVVVHAAVFAVFALEVIAPDLHSQIFQIQDYYINTRGLSLEDFYDTSLELFVSATRPSERFLSFIDAPRASSLFLEPVSLGNYCSIVTAFIVAAWRKMSVATRLFLAVGTGLMLVGCDGRLAIVTCAVIVVVAPFVTVLPPRSTVLYAPLFVAAAFALTFAAGLRAGTDDFAGRLANTVELLTRLDAPDLLGLTDALIGPAVDSGITYVILTQSLPLAVLLWLFMAWTVPEATAESERFTHALCLYLALSMMVSYAFLTIKTAGLAWFIQGALQGEAMAKGAPRRLRPADRSHPSCISPSTT